MNALNVAELTDNLEAAGLTPVVVDETTDFAEIDSADKPEIDSSEAPAASKYQYTAPKLTPLENTLVNVELLTRTLSRNLKRVQNMSTEIVDQRTSVTVARNDVTRAMTEGGDFDSATRAFKTANNKLDRLLETREVLLKNAQADITALRAQLDDLTDEVVTLEAE